MKKKVCAKCQNSYSVSFFPKIKSGIRSYCKKCWKIKNREYRAEWYKHNSKEQKEKSTRDKIRRIKRNIEEVNKLKNKCFVCGYNKCKSALDFHHKNNKKYNISIMIQRGHSLNKIIEEIKKCIVICARCHRELHEGLIKI